MEYKFLKLINGEDLIVSTEDNCLTLTDKEFISVTDPVLITSMRFPRGPMVVESYMMQPWIKMAKKDVMHIPTKHIIIAVDVHEMALKQYQDYVEESNQAETEKVNPMDFQDMEEEGVGPLEQFLRSAINNDLEEDDDDGTTTDAVGRTIH